MCKKNTIVNIPFYWHNPNKILLNQYGLFTLLKENGVKICTLVLV